MRSPSLLKFEKPYNGVLFEPTHAPHALNQCAEVCFYSRPVPRIFLPIGERHHDRKILPEVLYVVAQPPAHAVIPPLNCAPCVALWLGL